MRSSRTNRTRRRTIRQTSITAPVQRRSAGRHRVGRLTLAFVLLVVGCVSNGAGDTSTTSLDQTTTSVGETSPDTSPATTVGAATSTTVTSAATSTTMGGDASAEDSIVMSQTSFVPDEITVAVNTTVTWTNNDTIAHTTTSDDGTWDSGTMAPDDTFEVTFDEAGTYEYFCTIHASTMRGTITVEG